MTRTVKFRGRRLDNGEWEYGYFVEDGFTYICSHNEDDFLQYHLVSPCTVGQYTGLKDRNGVKVYEHDIMQYKDVIGIISYYPGRAQFQLKIAEQSPLTLHNLKGLVIGNIHDNPDLIK